MNLDHDHLNKMLNQIWNDGDYNMKLRVTEVVEQIYDDFLRLEIEKDIKETERKIIQFPAKD